MRTFSQRALVIAVLAGLAVVVESFPPARPLVCGAGDEVWLTVVVKVAHHAVLEARGRYAELFNLQARSGEEREELVERS